MNNIRFFMALRRPFGVVVLVLAGISACGYIFDIPLLYRPIAGGPASHPMTILCALVMAYAVGAKRRLDGDGIRIAGACFVVLVCLLRLLPWQSTADLFFFLTPFNAIVVADNAAGLKNGMGSNTAVMFLMLGLSAAFYRKGRPQISQLAAFLSLALPSAAMTGYAYGLSHFHGQMSMTTISFGLPLSIAAAAMSANRSMLRAILGPYVTGRIARVQIVLGYAFPFICGFLVLKTVRQSVEGDLFGVFVITISWFIIFLISVSSVVHERIDQARRMNERRMQRNAATDSLTGLLNRRSFDSCLETEFLRSRRGSLPLSMVMIDVDHFKQVNDTGGHGIGDMVLKNVARHLKSHKRQIDTLGRLGGEEFGLLLPNTPLEGAQFMAEALRKSIETLVFDAWPGHSGRITASFGCSVLNPGESAAELVRRADIALYRAKENGRNQVAVAL